MNKPSLFSIALRLNLLAGFSLMLLGFQPVYTGAEHGITGLQPANQTAGSTDWLDPIHDQMAQSEYQVSWQEDDLIVGIEAAYQAPNRAQNLRATFLPQGIRLARRIETNPEWDWGLKLIGFGYEGKLQNVRTANIQVSNNRVEYQRGNLIEWYLNDERGLEQGFTLLERPSGWEAGKSLLIEMQLSGALQPALASDRLSIDLSSSDGLPELRYGGLSVIDANGRSLPARLALEDDVVAIQIEDSGAIYPLLVDPWITTPVWSVEGNQHWGTLGATLDGAGDVNGDGYDDVIVGSKLYDSGESEEGKAFVFYGSSTGLGATADWTAESNFDYGYFAVGVSSAGDVNGDGYDDILILGGSDNDPGFIEYKAFLYYGSSTGLGPNGTTTNADWIAETHATNSQFSNSADCAGDVNGDGYDDIIIGATLGGSSGAAFVWYGGPGGMGPKGTQDNADWKVYGGANTYTGREVASGGDVDGDGYADVLIGSSSGLTVFKGSASGLTNTPYWTAALPVEDYNNSISAGDFNGDGYSDIVGGQIAYSGGAASSGAAFAWYGSASGFGPAGTDLNADWKASTTYVSGQFGYSVVSAGDIDGDGFDDLVVGAPTISNIGAAYFYHGSADGLIETPAFSYMAPGMFNETGKKAASAGDVNGDGCADVLVGAPQLSNGNQYEGKVFLFYGSLSETENVTYDWSFAGSQQNGYLGSDVSLGNVNGDDYADLIVGESGNGTILGNVKIFHGGGEGPAVTPSTVITSSVAAHMFGAEVSSAGDVNQDGYDDIIAGTPTYANGQAGEGAAYLYYGSPSGVITATYWFTESNLAQTNLGTSVASAGDVNGDGFDDVIIGQPLYPSISDYRGRVLVFYGSGGGPGSSPDWVGEEPDWSGASLGSRVMGVGDVNGDGYDDVMAVHLGYAFLWYGSASGLDHDGPYMADADWFAEAAQGTTYFGWSLSPAGDVNCDGYDDVIIGAPMLESPAPIGRTGKVFIWYGSSTGMGAQGDASNADWSAVGASAGDWFGSDVAGGGDLNQDGCDDLVIGANGHRNRFSGQGQLTAYYGSLSGPSTTPAWRAEVNLAGQGLGDKIATGGDANNDGYDDILAGTRGYGYDPFFGGKAYGRVLVYFGGEMIAGLAASNDGPTPLGQQTGLTASLTGGTKVVYTWDFGDGTPVVETPLDEFGAGSIISHTYAQAGIYPVTVQASNSYGTVEAETQVTIYETLSTPPGGNDATSDGVLGFEAPDTLVETLTITYTPQLTTTAGHGNFELTGISFQLEAADALGNPVIAPSQPLTLTIHYDPSMLPPGTNESTLELRRYDTGLTAWVPLTTLSLDATANILVVRLDHFSEFALLDVNQPVYLPVVLK